MNIKPSITHPENWTVYGLPTFLTDQVTSGAVVAFSMIYEPTEARRDRWRISAVKVVGADASDPGQSPDSGRHPMNEHARRSEVRQCPDCGTDLTPVRQPRSGRVAWWCWKCERYPRPGEMRSER